jgi:hypothetical protein
MCFEFIYACESHLVDHIYSLLGKQGYFLICLGHANYVFCDDLGSVQRLYDLLMPRGIELYDIEECILLRIADTQSKKVNYTFHGDTILFNKFREKSAISY